MGKVVTSAEMRSVVEANLAGYIEQTTESYARLFNKSPSFCTYYTHDPITSMTDVNLGGAIQLIGQESPLKYDRINDFPLYGIGEADLTAAYEETQGIVQNGVRGESYILPSTIEPVENDFFVIDYLESRLVFRVVACHPDRIEGKAFYKIEYILDPSDYRQLDRQTSGKYNFELSTIGTGANPIIEEDTAILLRETEVLLSFYSKAYWRSFYDRNSASLLLRDSFFPRPVHDLAVNMFVSRNDVISSDGYLKARSIIPYNYNSRGDFEDLVYTKTYYWLAEKGGLSPTKPRDLSPNIQLACMRPTSASSPFFGEFAIEGYLESFPSNAGEYSIGGIDFRSKLVAKEFDDLKSIRGLARRTLHVEGFNDEDHLAISEFNTLLNDESLLHTRDDMYWLLPIIIHRGKRFSFEARRRELP